MKQSIYETNGRAKEYSELALNLFSNCDHACTYCYAPLALHKDRQSFISNPIPRLALDDIEHGAFNQHKKGDTRRILLCFTCDPYMIAEQQTKITRNTIEILHKYDLNVIVLTKGGYRSMRDLDLLTPKDSYATTLTLTDNDLSKQYEPNAGLHSERIESLKEAYKLGIKTWVSFEPVIYPEQTFELLDLTKEFVGHYKCGKLNYQANKIGWRNYGWELKRRLDLYNCKFYFKVDLLKEMGINTENFKQTFICN